MADIESQAIHKETLHEEAPGVLHKGKHPVILKVRMHACMSVLQNLPNLFFMFLMDVSKLLRKMNETVCSSFFRCIYYKS